MLYAGNIEQHYFEERLKHKPDDIERDAGCRKRSIAMPKQKPLTDKGFKGFGCRRCTKTNSLV
jgi:hypothetical protein